ncbi:hypothetical protein R6Q59_004826 [Mikania micrantha]
MGKGGFIGADLVDKGLDDGHWVVFLNYSEGKKKGEESGVVGSGTARNHPTVRNLQESLNRSSSLYSLASIMQSSKVALGFLNQKSEWRIQMGVDIKNGPS